MFNLKKLMGGQEVKEEILLSNVAVVKGDIIGGASGYGSNAYSGIYTNTVIGVAQETVDNSGGSAGAKKILIETSPLALYVVDTADTATQATCFTNVALASANTITSLTAVTAKTGVVKIRQFISAGKVLASLNFASPTEAA